jgi:hypothetical protein
VGRTSLCLGNSSTGSSAKVRLYRRICVRIPWAAPCPGGKIIQGKLFQHLFFALAFTVVALFTFWFIDPQAFQIVGPVSSGVIFFSATLLISPNIIVFYILQSSQQRHWVITLSFILLYLYFLAQNLVNRFLLDPWLAELLAQRLWLVHLAFSLLAFVSIALPVLLKNLLGKNASKKPGKKT